MPFPRSTDISCVILFQPKHECLDSHLPKRFENVVARKKSGISALFSLIKKV